MLSVESCPNSPEVPACPRHLLVIGVETPLIVAQGLVHLSGLRGPHYFRASRPILELHGLNS